MRWKSEVGVKFENFVWVSLHTWESVTSQTEVESSVYQKEEKQRSSEGPEQEWESVSLFPSFSSHAILALFWKTELGSRIHRNFFLSFPLFRFANLLLHMNHWLMCLCRKKSRVLWESDSFPLFFALLTGYTNEGSDGWWSSDFKEKPKRERDIDSISASCSPSTRRNLPACDDDEQLNRYLRCMTWNKEFEFQILQEIRSKYISCVKRETLSLLVQVSLSLSLTDLNPLQKMHGYPINHHLLSKNSLVQEIVHTSHYDAERGLTFLTRRSSDSLFFAWKSVHTHHHQHHRSHVEENSVFDFTSGNGEDREQ